MDKYTGTPFTATGRGDVNRIPSRLLQKNSPQPTPETASGVITNNAMGANSPWRTLYLWVSHIETGWKMSTQDGQGPQGRTIYPHNITQDNIIVVGPCMNQFQYDHIVEFVSRSHATGVNWKGNGGSQIGKPHLTLELYPYFYSLKSWLLQTNTDHKAGSHEYNSWKYDIYIEEVAAGHERWKNAPEFQLSCCVVNDYLQDNVEVSDAIYRNLTKNYLGNLAPNGIIGNPSIKTTNPGTGTTPTGGSDTVTRPDNSGYWAIVSDLPSGDPTFGNPFS